VVAELASGAAGCALVRVAVGVLEDLRCCACCGGDFSDGRVEEMLSSRRLLRESLAERVRRWVRRGPHAEWPGSMGVPSAVAGVCAEASLDLKDRRSGMCSSWTTIPWWRSSGGCWCLQRVTLRCGTTLVTTAQVSAACYGLLSHKGVDGGVLCRVRLFSVPGFVRVVVCASARYVPLLFLLI
jgi:hypothetical protein